MPRLCHVTWCSPQNALELSKNLHASRWCCDRMGTWPRQHTHTLSQYRDGGLVEHPTHLRAHQQAAKLETHILAGYQRIVSAAHLLGIARCSTVVDEGAQRESASVTLHSTPSTHPTDVLDHV